jgi:A/G-specific adenine glycosylase
MLQQTQVKTVIPYWKRWMSRLPDLQHLAKARPDVVLKLWEGLGYYSRCRNMQRAAKLITARHRGRFPAQFEEILTLPGIGRYTAGAIASIAFNEPRPIVDGNVIRVLMRLFALPGDPREKAVAGRLWCLAEALVQAAATLPSPTASVAFPFLFSGGCSLFNQSVMELGATLCTPRRPNCSACPVRTRCVAHRIGRTADFPALAPRPAPTTRRFLALLVEHRKKWLVRRRPETGVNRGLWEFPNLEVTSAPLGPDEVAAQLLGLAPAQLRVQRFHTIHHSITRYRIALEAHHVGLSPGPTSRFGNVPSTRGRWLTLEQMDRLPFTGAHRRLLQCLVTSSAAPSLAIPDSIL